MRGRLGLGLVALGIFVGVMGGFLLNAETVTVCETEWEYVTDIAGAFQGGAGDLDEDFDSPANATGWSYLDEFNHGRISGVDWDPGATSVYAVSVGNIETSDGYLTVTASAHDGLSTPDATIVESGGGRMKSGEIMPDFFGLRNSEAVSFYDHDGVSEAGAFAVPISELAGCVTGAADMDLIVFSAASVSGYPAIAFVEEFTTSLVTYSGHNVTAFRASASASSSDATYRPSERTVEIDGQAYPASSVYVFWGQAQLNGAGAYDDSTQVSYVGRLAAQVEYMDASAGVSPTTGVYTTSDLVYTYHDGSSHPSFEMEFRNTRGGALPSEVACTGHVYFSFPGGGQRESLLEYGFSSGSNGFTSIVITIAGGTAQRFDGSGGSSTLSMSMSGGVMSFDVDGASAGSYTVTFPPGVSEIYELVFETDSSSSMPDRTYSAVADDGQGSSRSYSDGSGSASTWTASLDYATYQATEQSHPFARAYWHNGKENASVTMAFRAPDMELPYRNNVAWKGHDGNLTRTVEFDPSSGWNVGGLQVGMWEGIEIEVGYGKAVVRPIQTFRSFFDYSLIGTSVDLPSTGGLGDGTVLSIEAVSASTGYSNLRMAVVETTVRLAGGGQFLQDASLSIERSFPGSEAVSVMLGTAARSGPSVTFSSASAQSSASLPVDEDGSRIFVGGAWQPFNGVTFRWVSSGMPSETIDGTVYGAAIYHRGQTFQAGKIWAELKNGKMVEVMDAGDDWTMTLDGVWAPAVFLYDGHNSASKSTELADWTHPTFRWSANDVLIIMMGVSILGGLVGSYFKLVDLWDWTAIIGTVGALWLFLG